MRFDPEFCPKCGEPAGNLASVSPCVSELSHFARPEPVDGENPEDPYAEGPYEYGGSTDYDDGRPELDPDGRVELYCPAGHHWAALMDGAEPRAGLDDDRLRDAVEHAVTAAGFAWPQPPGPACWAVADALAERGQEGLAFVLRHFYGTAGNSMKLPE